MDAFEAVEELLRYQNSAADLQPCTDEQRRAIEAFNNLLTHIHLEVEPFINSSALRDSPLPEEVLLSITNGRTAYQRLLALVPLAPKRLLLEHLQKVRPQEERYVIAGDITINMGKSKISLKTGTQITIPHGYHYADAAVFILQDGTHIIVNQEHFPMDGLPVEQSKANQESTAEDKHS